MRIRETRFLSNRRDNLPTMADGQVVTPATNGSQTPEQTPVMTSTGTLTFPSTTTITMTNDLSSIPILKDKQNALQLLCTVQLNLEARDVWHLCEYNVSE